MLFTLSLNHLTKTADIGDTGIFFGRIRAAEKNKKAASRLFTKEKERTLLIDFFADPESGSCYRRTGIEKVHSGKNRKKDRTREEKGWYWDECNVGVTRSEVQET